MSETKRNVPKLRFPGFEREWEQRKLGEILIRRIEYKKQSTEYPRLAFASGQGVIPLSERKTNNRDQLTNDEFNKKYLVTEIDDIVYNPANIKYGAIGRNKCRRGLISPIYVTFTTNEVPGYLERIVESNNFQKKALRFEEGTVTKRQAVNPEDLLTIDIFISNQKKEQEKIEIFFESIDFLISIHQRKLENLKLKKKALLQKMFPKNGEQFPELRFPGFTDAWEQRKLGDLAKVEMDKRIYKEQTSAEGEIPFYKIGTFGGKADSYISEDLYNEYTRKYPHPKEGDILISASGSIGRTVVYHGEKAYFQDSNIVWLNHNGALNNEFLLQFYSRVKWAGLEGSTIKRLYNKNILETEINVPDIREQKNIGEFFTQVDNLITLHQRKLEHLQLQKKALLQQMFV